MFCRFCGSNIPDSAKFCPHCGEVLKRKEETPIEPSPIDSHSKPDFKVHIARGAGLILLQQSRRENCSLIVEKLSSSPLYGLELQLSGPPHIDIFLRLRKIHPTSRKHRIFFTIIAREPGTFILNAEITSKTGYRSTFPIDIKVEPTEINYSELRPKGSTIDSSSEPDFRISLEEDVETLFLHQYERKKFYLIVENLTPNPIYGAEVQLTGPPHVDFLIKSRKIHATGSRNRTFFTIFARELGTFILNAILTSKAGHRIAFPIEIQVEPTKINYSEIRPNVSTMVSSSETDFKISLEEDVETLFFNQYERKKFCLIVEKLTLNRTYGAEVQLTGPPHVDFLIKSRKIHAMRRKNRIYFTILARELGTFILNAILTSKAGHRIAFPIEIQVEPTKTSYSENPRARPPS